VRFLAWDALIRFELWGDRVAVRVRARCPGLPRLDGADDASFGVAPSLLVGYALLIGAPIVVAARSFDVRSVLVTAMIGGFAFKRLDARLLRRLDAWHRRGWGRRARPSTARVAARARRASEFAGRCAAIALASAVVLGALGCVLVRVHGPALAAQPPLAIAVLLAALSTLLATAMILGLLVELLAPTVLGPAQQPAHLISRADLAQLRPLLETRPARLVRDVWDLLRALRP
jgi:hypothetical protein